VQNIVEIEQIYENHTQTNKFYIIFNKNVLIDEGQYNKDKPDNILDRKVDYECENIDAASYIVAKIKTIM
jgi:hypothetical protein